MPRHLTVFIERFGDWLIAFLVLWLIAAYFILPMWWKRHESKHPALDNAPHITQTGAMIPGDPLNISIIGLEQELVAAMLAAEWHPADPITLKSSLRIAESTILHRSYIDAPVSNLYLFRRKEDLAFEKPVGRDASERHHVRFWKSAELDAEGRPCWFGAATFDRSVGFSHTTGQITHHIAPDLDAERDGLLADLQRTGRVDTLDWKSDFQPQGEGRNGGGDPWHTDKRLPVVLLRAQTVSAAVGVRNAN